MSFKPKDTAIYFYPTKQVELAVDMIVAAQEILYRIGQDEAANECDNVLGSIE